MSAAIDLENLRTKEDLADMHGHGKYFLDEASRREAATSRAGPTPLPPVAAITTDAAGIPVSEGDAQQPTPMLTAESGLFPGLLQD